MLPVGKLPVALLRRLLAAGRGYRDRRVVVGPGIGLDAAAIDLGGKYLVAKTDPVTLVGDELGAYALTINANDLATMGACPRWFFTTLLLPPGTTASQVARVFAEIHKACRHLNVALCGGHTEVTDSVTRPVVVGCLLGECRKSRLVSAAGARVGDAVLLTKGIAIEAVSILAREIPGELRRRYSPPFVARCRRYLTNPGISIVREASLALAAGGVHAMHDPTEGGLSAALYELAEASGVGLRIEHGAVRVLPEAARLCADLGIDPMGAIASGALLLAVDPRYEHRVRRRLETHRIPVARIGTVVAGRMGVTLVHEGRRIRSVPKFAVDEIARWFSQRAGASAVRKESNPRNRRGGTES